MGNDKQLIIGLFGFGVVGEGLYRILNQTPTLNASIKKVCIKNPNKKRNAPASLFTTNADEILNDPEINVVVEVINETDAAFRIVSTALRNGKDAVSANKKMIATYLPELLTIQQETGRSLLYEASACASIPIIRNLEEYYDNDLLQGLTAIVNGSTNYILTKMFDEQLGFKDALLQAQQLGFAEADPSLDIEGWDALYKWIILLLHAYGIVAKPEDILFTGIHQIHNNDAVVGREKQYEIRLIAQAKKLKTGKIAAFVLPQFVKPNEHLRFVKNEYNGTVLESSFSDKQFFYGKGAGSFPTASAVLSDLSALRYDYHYEHKKLRYQKPAELTDDFYLKVYVSFDDWNYIEKNDFLWIEEWHAENERKYLVGVIHAERLKNKTWWRENGNSLILTPDAIVEDVDIRNLKKKSLELAGVQLG
ncbi:MAG: homoserine dehydrogenase [Chitinophagaceae bacterium]|nr:homoserine dehydrogenase [Chitinophagaceae bacterium]